MFVAETLRLGLGLLNSVVTVFSFATILWGLSSAAPLTLFGLPFDIPGYLVWAALIYSDRRHAAHPSHRPAADRLNFTQQRYEADFRFNLVRVRENSEQIALLRGESAERGGLGDRFGRLIANWHEIMSRTKKVTAFQTSYAQAAIIFPFVIGAPGLFFAAHCNSAG